MYYRRPDVTIKGDEVTVHSVYDRKPHPLNILHHPLSFTFAFFDGGEIMVIDPCYKEELVMDGRIIVTVNVQQQICALQKAGGTPLTIEQVSKCAQMAAIKVSQTYETINAVLKSADVIANPLLANAKGLDIQSIVPLSVQEVPFIGKMQEDTRKEKLEHKSDSTITSEQKSSKAKSESVGLFEGKGNAWANEDESMLADDSVKEQPQQVERSALPEKQETSKRPAFGRNPAASDSNSKQQTQTKDSTPSKQQIPKASTTTNANTTTPTSSKARESMDLDGKFSDEEDDVAVLDTSVSTPGSNEKQNSSAAVELNSPTVVAQSKQGKSAKAIDLSAAIKRKK
eukprot:TRINITY_DN4242_c0_g2_i1.p1 TRINITY_DN4242_c0_g2~~TRINITY_DN4242_c0_g2_i1.p1  ORF type:complete len:342 (-),score=101.51 TRINITY_DN4242_c0_g2_i1:427-1452(-)